MTAAWFDDLASIKFSHVLTLLERSMGASRWDGKLPYRDFLMGETRRVTAWAKKRRIDAWQMMAALKYCIANRIVIMQWWDLEPHIPSAVAWMHVQRDAAASAEKDILYAEAMTQALQDGDGWYERLATVGENYRQEVYEEWLEHKKLHKS